MNLVVNSIDNDWRTQLPADSRDRIVNKIFEALKRHFLYHGEAGLEEFKKIAKRFEERIYNLATSQSDYLRKLSLKMLSMERDTRNPINQETAVSFLSWSKEVDNTELNSYGRFRFYLYSTKLGNVLAATGIPNLTRETPFKCPIIQILYLLTLLGVNLGEYIAKDGTHVMMLSTGSEDSFQVQVVE